MLPSTVTVILKELKTLCKYNNREKIPQVVFSFLSLWRINTSFTA